MLKGEAGCTAGFHSSSLLPDLDVRRSESAFDVQVLRLAGFIVAACSAGHEMRSIYGPQPHLGHVVSPSTKLHMKTKGSNLSQLHAGCWNLGCVKVLSRIPI